MYVDNNIKYEKLIPGLEYPNEQPALFCLSAFLITMLSLILHMNIDTLTKIILSLILHMNIDTLIEIILFKTNLL